MEKYFVFLMGRVGERVMQFSTLYDAMRYGRDLAVHTEQTIRVLQTDKDCSYSVEYLIRKDC